VPPAETTPSRPASQDGARRRRQPPSSSGRPPAKSTPESLPPGDVLEARVAQLWFWEGFYARRGINLERHYEPDPLQITDLDLLAFDLDPALARRKHIGEVKSGTGRSAAKPLDRTIWLRGLRELVGAEHAELTTAIAPSRRARELAAGLGVTAQSVADVERRERSVVVEQVSDLGAHGPAAAITARQVQRLCAQDPKLERAFWYLRSEVWFLDPWAAAKRSLGLIRTLNQRWTPQVDDDDARALRWLYAEALSSWTLNVVTLAGEAARLDGATFLSRAHERLAEGAVPAAYQRRLSEAIDKYMAGVLAAAQAPAVLRTEAMGAFVPQPPDWAGSLVELVHRLAANPTASRELPRRVDLLLFERLVNRRHILPAAVERLTLTDEAFGGQRRLLAAFLRAQPGLPEAVDKSLTAPVLTNPAEPYQEGRQLAPDNNQSASAGPGES